MNSHRLISLNSQVSPGQLAALSRLFSSTVIQEMARKGRSPVFARLAQETNLHEGVRFSETVGNFLDLAFSVLKRQGFRDEYVYKAALMHNILLGTHSLHTACMLNEFRVGECKADLVILNGTATVYEVKSERDSLQRLSRQVEAYMKVFARVCVIASENHIGSVRYLIPGDVGILSLNRRGHISTIRKATDRPDRICPAAIFDSLRAQEAKMILLSRGIAVPEVPNTVLHSTLKNLFQNLQPQQAHQGMVDVLKKSRNLIPLSSLLNHLPKSLHTAVLSIPLRKIDHLRLVTAVKTSFGEAMEWA